METKKERLTSMEIQINLKKEKSTEISEVEMRRDTQDIYVEYF